MTMNITSATRDNLHLNEEYWIRHDTGPITSFHGEHAFLSNFYALPAQCVIRYEGVSYPTVEHAYQAQKTLDPLKRLAIANYYTPGAAKRAGGNLALREDWESVKDAVMLELLELKFGIPVLREMLVGTGDKELREGNRHHDNYWGVCGCGTGKCQGVVGRNMLGKLLMIVRGNMGNGQTL